MSESLNVFAFLRNPTGLRRIESVLDKRRKKTA